MFDVNAMSSKDTMNYWFVFNSQTDGWDAFKRDESTDGEFNINKGAMATMIPAKGQNTFVINFSNECLPEEQAAVENELENAFNVFKHARPEYMIHYCIEPALLTEAHDSQELLDARIHTYTTYLAGAMLLHGSTPAQIQRCIEWLGSAGFYDSPASTRFHEAFPGGLLLHSLRVVNQIIQLASLPAFSSVNLGEAVLVALSHDWCKIGKYEMYMKNVKDENTGTWNKEPAYKYKDSSMPFGHGMTSLYILQKFVKIRTEEALAVRWHMGRWYVAESEINDLQQSNEQYPLVHMLQFADQLAITDYTVIN